MRPRSLLPALILGLASFIAYRLTAAPSVLPGDAGEFQFTAPLAGLSHPTGYPLYHLLGWAWGWLYQGNAAQGASHFSALWGGLAVGLFYLLSYEALTQLTTHLQWRRGAGWLAALTTLVFAANPTLWAQATQAEVYTLQAAFVAALLGATLAVGRGRNRDERPSARLIAAILALLLGLALTHHLTIVLLLPGIVIYLLLVRPDAFTGRRMLRLAPWLLVPLLFYLYVPLRAPASPWLNQTLAPGLTLDLFDESLAGVLRYIFGLGFAPSLHGPAAALAQVPMAAQAFLGHFGWAGLALIALGLIALALEDQLPALILTGVSFVCCTVFNLFYGIKDIAAFYIPSYLIATLWLGLGLAYVVELATRAISARLRYYLLPFAALVLILPYLLFVSYRPQFDRSRDYEAAVRWLQILSQPLPENAILVSNDRDEMTPMFYFQYVGGRAAGMSAVFPLISPDPAWADLNTTLSTALTAGRPVYTIKPMPGLEALYRVDASMEEANGGVIWIEGPHPAPVPSFESPYGPYLRWLNTDWSGDTAPGGEMAVTLIWRVTQTPPVAWHSFLHLLDANGNKVAQADDHRPGGDYVPATLWRPGDVVHDTFRLALPSDLPPGDYSLVAGFYDPLSGERMADPLTVAAVRSP